MTTAPDQSSHTQLHVYGGPELLAHLKENRLPVVTFERMGNPWFRSDIGVGNEATVSEEQWQRALAERYESLPAHLRGAVDFDYFAEQLSHKRSEIEADILAQAKGTASGQLDLLRHRGVAVLRLMASPVNPLAWQLLGDNHRGLCVSLNQTHALFKPQPGYPKLLAPVRYTKGRRTEPTPDQPFPGWFEEPESAGALQEWRLAVPKNHLSQQAQKNQDGGSGSALYTLAVPSGAVTRITVGALATDETLQGVAALRRLYQRYRAVPLSTVQAAERTFKLQLRALDGIQ